MATKDKRYKYVEDLIEDYLYLTDERTELSLKLKKTKDKFLALKEENQGTTLDRGNSGRLAFFPSGF